MDVLQSSMNLLRAANFDLAVIQVLGQAEVDPPPIAGRGGGLLIVKAATRRWSVLTPRPKLNT